MPWAELTIGFVTILLNTFLGLFVWLRYPRSWTNRLFFILSFFISVYVITNYLSLHPPLGTAENQLLWIRVVMANTSLISPTLFLLVHTFPKDKLQIKPYKLVSFIVLGLVSFSVSLLPFVFTDIQYPGGQPLPTPGPGMPIFFIDFIGIFILSFFYLIYKYRKTSGLEKVQHLYFLLGVIATFSIMGGSTVVLVAIFKFSGAVVLGPISSLLLVAFIAYAIIKHRFLDIRLVLARTVSYAILTLTIVSFYTLALFLIGNWVLPITTTGSQLVISTILALVIAYTFQPLRGLLEKITDNIFFQENYNPEQFLGRISRILGSSIELGKLSVNVLEELLKTLHLEGAILVLFENGQYKPKRVIRYKWKGETLPCDSNVCKEIFSSQSLLLSFEDLTEGTVKQFMRNHQIGSFVALKVKENPIGALILGMKLGGDIYSSQDLRVLEILAPQMAIAVQNAKQYEEIQRFSEKLKVEVEKATADLQVANKKLKLLDQRKDEFISVAAHELRAPMTAIKGYLSMILEGDAGKISPEASDYLSEAVGGNDRLIRLVNNMLNVARIEEGRMVFQMGTVSLAKVVATVFHEFEPDAKQKGLTFLSEIKQGIEDAVFVDRDRIHEVVANFMSNAIKYTDQGSVTVKLLNRENKVRFEVKDTGPGISQADQGKLFQKFSRVESSAGKKIGTGLGLYISKLLVEEFGGKIGVQSELSKGSTFWFELPLKKENSTS